MIRMDPHTRRQMIKAEEAIYAQADQMDIVIRRLKEFCQAYGAAFKANDSVGNLIAGLIDFADDQEVIAQRLLESAPQDAADMASERAA